MIVSTARTPSGRLGGGLALVPATELGAIAIRAALDRVRPRAERGRVRDHGPGAAGRRGPGARAAGRRRRDPKEIPADTVNKVCASSIRAIEIADLMIRSGEHELVVTGGMESMSNAPYLLPKARFGYRLGNGEVVDHGLRRPHVDVRRDAHGRAGVARLRELGISREEQDEWAYRSHQRAAAAQDDGRFDDEIVAVGDVAPTRASAATRRSRSSPLSSPSSISRARRPRERAGRQRRRVLRHRLLRGVRGAPGLEPLATILAQGYVADDYAYLARTPASAGEQALEKAGKTIGDVARVEINEAFSSVAKNSTRMLGADEEIVNVNGGAVALGHPIGASGGIVSTMIHELRRTEAASGCRDLLGRRPGRRAPRRGLKPLVVIGLAALAFASPAACAVRRAPLDERLDDADAAVVGRVVAERPGDLNGLAPALPHRGGRAAREGRRRAHARGT